VRNRRSFPFRIAQSPWTYCAKGITCHRNAVPKLLPASHRNNFVACVEQSTAWDSVRRSNLPYSTAGSACSCAVRIVLQRNNKKLFPFAQSKFGFGTRVVVSRVSLPNPD
jgi:hypothetical protein